MLLVAWRFSRGNSFIQPSLTIHFHLKYFNDDLVVMTLGLLIFVIECATSEFLIQNITYVDKCVSHVLCKSTRR